MLPLDLMTFMLPMLFVLAIAYGGLEVAGVFKNRAVNALIALVVAFLAVSNAALAEFVVSVMPWAAMLFIIVFFIKFMLSMFKTKEGEKRDYTLIIVILGLVAIFLAGQGSIIEDWLPSGFPISEESLILLIGVIVIIAMFFAAYKSKSE